MDLDLTEDVEIDLPVTVDDYLRKWGVVELLGTFQDDMSNLALLLLPAILRGGKTKGICSVQETLTSFIDMQPECTNIEEYLKTLDGDERPQPFVMARAGTTILKPSQCYVVIERQAITLTSLMAAVDLAYKATFLFDMSYQQRCLQVWQFLQCMVYDMAEGSNIQLTPKMRELRAFIGSADKLSSEGGRKR